VPGEVSVIGYDDSRLARLTHINLTTRRPGPEQMARRAVESSNGWKASPACHR
jgi:DNA-binding LacI/PurR family transcriptional regulator